MRAFLLLSLLVTFSVQAQRHPHRPAPSKPSYCEEWINKDEARCQPSGHSSQKPPKYCEDWINADEPICQTGTRPNSWHPAYCEEWIHKDDEICQPAQSRTSRPAPESPTATPTPATHHTQVHSTGDPASDDAMCSAGYTDWCR